MPQSKLKQRIRSLRNTRGWTFRKIAERLGISQSSAAALYHHQSTKRYVTQCLYCKKKKWLLSEFRRHIVQCAMGYFSEREG